MRSRVSNKDVHLGEHRKQKPFLKFNDLQCPTCKRCLYSANHDECVLEYLSKLNPRAPAQNKDAKSHKITKRYMPVEKTSESKKPERQIPTGHSAQEEVSQKEWKSSEMTFEHSSSSLGHQCQMASAENNTSGASFPQCSENDIDRQQIKLGLSWQWSSVHISSGSFFIK
ncbi:hypothetical protein Tco_0934306 [Tanacetum coccineum]